MVQVQQGQVAPEVLQPQLQQMAEMDQMVRLVTMVPVAVEVLVATIVPHKTVKMAQLELSGLVN
jgi:hypothetical protein